MRQKSRHLRSLGAALLLAATLPACGEGRKGPAPERDPAASTTSSPHNGAAISPIPAPLAGPSRKVALGEQLFNDKRLSKDKSLSCASCHALDKGGVDGLKVSIGVGGASGPINAPTVLNASLNFVQFWDGRAATLEEQAGGPIENPLEMAATFPQVIERLNADAAIKREFVEVYGAAPTPQNIRDAIATFERTLLTPNSRFDKFLRGERGALNPEEQRGYDLFKDYGCSSCHQGAGIGGNMYQRFGVIGDYFADRGNITSADLGRFNVTKREEDRHVFKVPSLRNVARTAPYFHDGSAATLDDAVRVMARYQLGRDLAREDQTALVSFLNTLTGELKGKPL